MIDYPEKQDFPFPLLLLHGFLFYSSASKTNPVSEVNIVDAVEYYNVVHVSFELFEYKSGIAGGGRQHDRLAGG